VKIKNIDKIRKTAGQIVLEQRNKIKLKKK
jgi:hypothetical protein